MLAYSVRQHNAQDGNCGSKQREKNEATVSGVYLTQTILKKRGMLLLKKIKVSVSEDVCNLDPFVWSPLIPIHKRI